MPIVLQSSSTKPIYLPVESILATNSRVTTSTEDINYYYVYSTTDQDWDTRINYHYNIVMKPIWTWDMGAFNRAIECKKKIKSQQSKVYRKNIYFFLNVTQIAQTFVLHYFKNNKILQQYQSTLGESIKNSWNKRVR